MLLYIHVPFCQKKCAYCAFYSIPLTTGRKSAELATGYLSSLLRELRFWGSRLGKRTVTSIFFGGGTPSLLPAIALAGILKEVGAAFEVAPQAEITAEANPESALADGWLFEARQAGINRLSLGVQSLNDADLVRLGRVHTAHSAEVALTTARSAGFANVSLDFMWGLPGEGGRPQSQRQWVSQLRRAIELKPEHISAYGLSLEPGSPLSEACEQGMYSFPSESELASMYVTGAEFLEANGYLQYEISNFSRMGLECRHNLGYWQGEEYLGLGPAATSTIANRRWTNPADLVAWQQCVNQGKPTDLVEELDFLTRIKECLMLRLRMSKGISYTDYAHISGRSFPKDFSTLVAALQKNGLAATRNGWFRLTRSGMLVSDTIVAHFFAALDSLQPALPNERKS